MKKIISFLLVAVFGITAATAQWATYDVPAEVSAVSVSENAVYVFGETNYWQANFPLPENPAEINWIMSDLPVANASVTHAGFVGNELFVLMGDKLFSSSSTPTDWHYHFDNVTGMSADGRRLFIWFDSIINVYDGNHWSILDNCDHEIITLAFQGDNVLTFSPSRNLYLNATYWQPFEEFTATDIALHGDNYTAVGTVVGGYAAFYSSPLNFSFSYIHVLTPGELVSVANFRNQQYVAGNLNGTGIIFDAANLSDLKITDNPVIQIRSGRENNVIAAIEANALHVRGQHMTVLNTHSLQKNKFVLVNPIVNSVWQVVAEEDDILKIYDAVGRLVAEQVVVSGNNIFSLNLKPGIYLAGGKKIVVQ